MLLASSDGRVVGAAHAGWRGIVAGVLPETIATMQRQWGVEAVTLAAAIGPHIGVAHFEVGPKVADAFEAADLAQTIRHDLGPKPHIDLGQAAMLQLQRAGIPVEQIDANDCCTFRDAELFYSYRRDGQRSGRMAAVIIPQHDHET